MDQIRKGIDYRLLYHKPYYLAASHYALQDYQTVVNSFSNLVHSSTVGNRAGLQLIVAYAFYKLEDYTEAVRSFEEIAQQRTLTPEEAYLLGSALQKVGRSQEAEKVWAQVSSLENDLQDRATYDYALQLHDNGRYEEAIEAFKKFLGSKKYDQTDIHYNLALLYGKTEQYDLVVHHALELSTTPRKEDANRLLEKTVNHVQSPELYKAIATSIMTSSGEHEMLKKSLYQRGVESLKQHDFDSANQYFNLLADADPLIEQRGEVAAWKGIMAYHEDNYPKAQRYLTNFLKSKSISTETQLVFDANYFLGYTFFKLGQHQQSLGHLTQVLHHPRYKDATTSIKVDAALRVSDNYFLLADYTNAQKAYEQTLESPGSHQPYALWQTAVIAELQNRPYDQIMILERLLDEFPHSSYAPDGAFAKANTLFGLQKYGRAAEVYERLLNNATVNTQIKEEATSQLGLIAINAGDYDRAATYYNSLINSSQNDELKERSRLALKEIYGNYTYDTDAYINLIKTENGNEESEAVDDALFDLAYNTYAEGKYTESISQWKRYLSEFADGNRRQEANYYLAKCYQEDAKWVESTTHYKQAIDGENQKIREESTTLIKAILF
ncbi:MAG: tetratricopeptide repeat protein, partial [Bacteroidota bacterium]